MGNFGDVQQRSLEHLGEVVGGNVGMGDSGQGSKKTEDDSEKTPIISENRHAL